MLPSSSAKASTCRGGDEEEEREEPILNKIANKWMTIRDLMKVRTCAHTCVHICSTVHGIVSEGCQLL